MARDPVAERLRSLAMLTDPVKGGLSLDQRVRINLEAWYSKGPKPSTIKVRDGFARRTPPLTPTELKETHLEDRPKPELPREPPLAALTRRPKGVGLRLALTLLFLAQTSKGAVVGSDGRLNIGVESDDDAANGLVDLIAVPAHHTPPPGGSTYGSSARINRRRQVQNALVLLADAGIGMVELPEPGSHKRFTAIRLCRETGSHTQTPPPYRPPEVTSVFEIPVDFFLKGWVHSLRNIEIAMWLMLRSEVSKAPPSTVDSSGVRVTAQQRLGVYDLSIAAYESNVMLRRFDLITAEIDPLRRLNGTTIGGKRSAAPHSFRLADEHLDAEAASVVRGALMDSAGV